MTEIDDKELARRLRHNILQVLDLWSSKEKQLGYQSNVPIADVSGELFCQWADDFYYPESTYFKMAFDEKEREILADFDKIFNKISDSTPNQLPYITEFVESDEWRLVNEAAIDTLKKLQ